MCSLKPKILGQFARFAGFGVVGTAAHYVILFILVSAKGADPIISSTCGFIGGALTNYFLNYYYNFNSSVSHFIGLSKFLTVASIGLLLNSLVMSVGTNLMRLHYLFAQLMATGLVLIWNFLGNRIWTFRDSSHEKSR